MLLLVQPLNGLSNVQNRFFDRRAFSAFLPGMITHILNGDMIYLSYTIFQQPWLSPALGALRVAQFRLGFGDVSILSVPLPDLAGPAEAFIRFVHLYTLRSLVGDRLGVIGRIEGAVHVIPGEKSLVEVMSEALIVFSLWTVFPVFPFISFGPCLFEIDFHVIHFDIPDFRNM